MAGDRDVGYICDYPIYGQIAGINAFALGVELTNPRSKVRLEWSSVDGHRAARKKLEGEGVELISCQDLTRQPDGGFGMNGLMRREGDDLTMLAAPVWRWDVYYEALLRRILNKTAQDEYALSARALNYYWGMSAGVLDVYCAPSLTEGVRKLAHILKSGIRANLCDPFQAPVRYQDGREASPSGEAFDLEHIAGMDCLVDNVIGAIPAFEALNRGRDTVEVMGVEASAKSGKLGEARMP